MSVPESLDKSVKELSANGAYFDGLINWFDTQLAQTAPGQSVQPLVLKSHKYVEDSLGSIADNIVNCAAQLSAFVGSQTDELEALNHRMQAVHTKLDEADSVAGHNFYRQLNASRAMPKRRLKLRVLTGDELPALARPKAKYQHQKIDLNYLETVGVSGNMDFVPQTLTRQTSTLNLPTGVTPPTGPPPSAASASSSSIAAAPVPPVAANPSPPAGAPPANNFDSFAPPLLSARGASFAGNDPTLPPSLASFRAGGSFGASAAPAPAAPAAPAPAAPAFAAPPSPSAPGAPFAPFTPPTPPGHRPSLSGGGPVPPPRPAGRPSFSAPGAPPTPPPMAPPVAATPPPMAPPPMAPPAPSMAPPPMAPPPMAPPPPGAHRPSMSAPGGPPAPPMAPPPMAPPPPQVNRPSMGPPPMAPPPPSFGAPPPPMPPPMAPGAPPMAPPPPGAPPMAPPPPGAPPMVSA